MDYLKSCKCIKTLYFYLHPATHTGVKRLCEKTAGCRADTDSSAHPPVVQLSEVNSAEPDRAPVGAPSPAALQDPPHSTRTAAERSWSNRLPTKNKAWKLQPLDNTKISLCTLRSVTYGRG